MGNYISKPVKVVAIRFNGDNAKEFEKAPNIKNVQGPYDLYGVKVIELWNDFMDFELPEGDWGLFYENGRCEWMSDEEFHQRLTPIDDDDADIERWSNEGGKV